MTNHERGKRPNDDFRSVPERAKQAGIAPKKVRGWIESGELVAVNVASTKATRPIYRIGSADWQRFLDSRTSMPQTPAPARRPRRESYKEFV